LSNATKIFLARAQPGKVKEAEALPSLSQDEAKKKHYSFNF